MPWARVIGGEPPTERELNYWEDRGWSQIHVVGPCPTIDPVTRKPTSGVYLVYLWRSIIEPGGARVGWPKFEALGPQDATPRKVAVLPARTRRRDEPGPH